MINTLIFSKNRASQLLYLLYSLDTYVPEGLLDVSVLYNGEDNEFLKGYEIVKDCCKNSNIQFVQQTDFQQNVKDWFVFCDNPHFFMFLCDDDIFYRPLNFTYEEIVRALEDRHSRGLSLRLGKNITQD